MSTPSPARPPLLEGFDPAAVPSPCYVVDYDAVEYNVSTLRHVADEAGATILVALKAFSPSAVFPLFRHYLDGASASGLYEAQLARDEIAASDEAFQIHTSGPAYPDGEIERLLEITDHLIFNSLGQWLRVRNRCLAARVRRPQLAFGLRINPECSLGEVELYDPCAPFSRLGTTAAALTDAIAQARRAGIDDPLDGISGLHMHTLCEDDADKLETTLDAAAGAFGDLLSRPEIRWFNLGGGHHITRADYDRERLVRIVRETRQRWDVEVFLEPGEATAIHTGVLVATVLDLHHNRMPIAILDTSATAHMPDTLEMPYRAHITGSHRPGEAAHTYRLGGRTCLAGDVIGDYSFAEPLIPGQRLVFEDMSHYTMVKTTTFNGVPLPSIATWYGRERRLDVVRRPTWDDFRSRLG